MRLLISNIWNVRISIKANLRSVMFLKIVTIFAIVKPSMPPWYKIREGRPRSIPSLVALRKEKTTRGRRKE